MSIRELAARHGVHRRDVRAALLSAVPPARKPRVRTAPKLGVYHELIDAWLTGDRAEPRKQRHTARRVWERLRDEHGAQVAERTVAYYVHERRRELGLASEGFVPQQHEPGAEGEVDWGQARVVLDGVPTVVRLFVMRASFSGASYVQAFLHETQQAFLEAHTEAFDYFGGIFTAIWYDNLASAVRSVLRGRLRVENERFAQYRSHYGYASDFTLAGIRGAHEKGGVEGEVGRFRRRHLVPIPEVKTLAELNMQLRAACIKDLDRCITGRDETVGEALARERECLNDLPEYPYVTYEVADFRVNDKS
ncbi:MAG: IS21 family transposase, partial [Thermoleophilia bacterium]|nr:IS21 family transposase [Thermoleophilia bacterium]